MRTVHPGKLSPLAPVAAGALVLAAVLVSFTACRSFSAVRKLAPAHRDFLNKVGYIITKDERKIFLALPESGRDAFVEEFWKRRDPDPDTAGNEFRVEYEGRVAKAGALFHGEGRPGWQTDRGRIFILFGPPSERQTYPMDAAGFCREIWYYGAFPVVFIDEHCSGDFVMRAINLEHLQELNIAQGRFQKTIIQENRLFDYEVGVQRVRAEEGVYEARVFVDIPYDTIWLSFKDGRLETEFEVRLEMSDRSGTTLWEAQGTFPLVLEEKDLTVNRQKRFRMEFPLVLDKDVDRLRGQKIRLDVSVKSATGGEELKKAVGFELEF